MEGGRLNLGRTRDICSETSSQEERDWEEGARQINECEYLYIDSVRELEELTLELIVTEAKVQAQILVPRDESPVEQLRLGARPIEKGFNMSVFQIDLRPKAHGLLHGTQRIVRQVSRITRTVCRQTVPSFLLVAPAGVHKEDDLCVR